MFTGIIEEIGTVISAQRSKLVIAANTTMQGIKQGGSIAINGACLTITEFGANSFSVDVMTETLRRTNVGLLRSGDKVNLERPLALNGELGGHLVQGHIDGTGRIASIQWEGEAMLLMVEASPEVMRFTVPKGFIAVDGTSLTIMTKDSISFWASLVEYTRQNTVLGEKKIGDMVNLEADIIAKYVEQLSQNQNTGVTFDLLKEHGFLVG